MFLGVMRNRMAMIITIQTFVGSPAYLAANITHMLLRCMFFIQDTKADSMLPEIAYITHNHQSIILKNTSRRKTTLFALCFPFFSIFCNFFLCFLCYRGIGRSQFVIGSWQCYISKISLSTDTNSTLSKHVKNIIFHSRFEMCIYLIATTRTANSKLILLRCVWCSWFRLFACFCMK